MCVKDLYGYGYRGSQKEYKQELKKVRKEVVKKQVVEKKEEKNL